MDAKLIHLIESERHLACAECGEEFGCEDGLISHVRRVSGSFTFGSNFNLTWLRMEEYSMEGFPANLMCADSTAQVHRHKLKPVMQAIEQQERRERQAEIEGLVDETSSMKKHCELGISSERAGKVKGDNVMMTRDDREISLSSPRNYVDHTEWMAIRMAKKGLGFW